MDDIRVIIEAIPDPRPNREQFIERALAHAAVRAELDGVDAERIIVAGPEGLGRPKDRAFERLDAHVFDPVANHAVRITGPVDDPGQWRVRPSNFRPNPTHAELQVAAGALQKPAASSKRGSKPPLVYQPMPPLADEEQPDGTSIRRVALGTYDATGPVHHRFVAVDRHGAVAELPTGVDGSEDCEARLPIGVVDAPRDGGPDRVRVRVLHGNVELWNLVVIRPRASTPQTHGKGSGVELQMVRYRGRLVLWQAHVPILNVLYDDGVSFRDWQNEETVFAATGADPVGPGFRLCTQPPATILEAGTDAGNFQGVAFWFDGTELRIVSEMAAGWYRYVSDWRLDVNGTIRPRFGFAGTRNPRTCMVHHHHVYWRLDFDIDGATNDVVEERGLFFPPNRWWTPIVREAKRTRSPSARAWRVLDRTTRHGYQLVPGVADGTADSYGSGDLWVMRYHADELDDGVSAVAGTAAQTSAKLDQFLNNESVDGQDIVVWYAGHFDHDEHHPTPHQGHIIGPELRPL